ncbi:hypothetical protein GCM10009081_29010 [Brevundimonas nasdae]
MTAEVSSIIAEGRSRKIECTMCAGFCDPVMITRRTQGRDHFEHLRCTNDNTTFRRVWIGGYAR